MKAVEEGDELFAASRVHRELQRSLDGFGTAVCEVCARRRLHGHDRIEFFRKLRHVAVVVISATHVYEFGCLVLDRFDDLGMAMSGGTHCNAGVAVEKNVAVNVFNPDPFSAFGDEFKGRPRVGRGNELCVCFNDLLAVWTGQRLLDLGALRWCDYAGRLVHSPEKGQKASI